MSSIRHPLRKTTRLDLRRPFGRLGGGGVVLPDPALVQRTLAQAGGQIGFATQPSAGRWNMTGVATPGTAFAMRIKGSTASMFAFSGDATPFRVLVDSDTFASFTAPTLSGGKIPLFTGLADTTHDVIIWQDNSDTGQGFASTGPLFESFGSSATIEPLGSQYYLGQSASFPGIATAPRIDAAGTLFPAGYKQIVSASGWGNRNIGSIHFRANYEKIYVFARQNVTFANVSIDGGTFALVALSDFPVSSTLVGWRKLDLPASTSTVRSVIISGVGIETAATGDVIVQGLMVVGGTVTAPTGTRRHCAIFGGSQIEGVTATGNGYKTDIHLVQDRIGIYAVSLGLAGGTITALNTALPASAATLAVRDICMFSVGINSLDDANFQTDYQTLIQTAITAGFQKILCRGLVQVDASNASKNAKIAAAVATFSGNPISVQYLDVSTWGATVDGAGGTIAMPDGTHPNGAGYQTMADFWVRDHAAFFV